MPFPASELILRPDNSIYHLHLRPEDLADTIITVGDPDRVARVSRHFDHVEVKKAHREFITHTGKIGLKRISVISTGIGPDNIDIVLNEADALANIDFATRTPHIHKKSLRFIRIGTSGCLQESIPVGTFLKSGYGLGLDNLLWYYTDFDQANPNMLESLKDLPGMSSIRPYLCQAPGQLFHAIGKEWPSGITVTSPGFYAPQGRQLLLKSILHNKMEAWGFWEYEGWRITNFEMETSALYGLAGLMGHEAISLNALIANRTTGTFASDPDKLVDQLIEATLADIVQLP
jgi:uridine phosphorylase